MELLTVDFYTLLTWCITHHLNSTMALLELHFVLWWELIHDIQEDTELVIENTNIFRISYKHYREGNKFTN